MVGSIFGQWPQEHPGWVAFGATWPTFGAFDIPSQYKNIWNTPPSPGLALDLLWFYYLFILRVFGSYSMGWLSWTANIWGILGVFAGSSHICWLFHISFCVSSLFLGNVLIFWWTIHQIQVEHFHFGHTMPYSIYTRTINQEHANR